MTRRVLVVGAEGSLGRRVARILASQPDVDVVTGSRSPSPSEGHVRFDLVDERTYAVLDRVDAVVNCAGRVGPSELLSHCIARGVDFVETSADAQAVEPILCAHRNRTVDAGPGRLLVGAGIFPGLSNLAAKKLCATVDGCRKIEIFISSSPLSGAGASVAKLMVEMLTRNGVAYEGGNRVEYPPGRPGPRVVLGRGRERSTVLMAFPETAMLRRSSRAEDIACYFAARPRLFTWVLRSLAVVGVLRWRWVAEAMRKVLVLLRGVLLRRVPTEVIVRVVANRLGTERIYSEGTACYRAPDGMELGAHAVAAMTRLLADRAQGRSGLLLVEEVFELGEVCREIAAQSHGAMIFEEIDGATEGGQSELSEVPAKSLPDGGR